MKPRPMRPKEEMNNFGLPSKALQLAYLRFRLSKDQLYLMR
jgi:hypothetical protein